MRVNEEITMSAGQALEWLKSYHRETLDLSLKLTGLALEMIRISSDLNCVDEPHRAILHKEYSTRAEEFERLRKILSKRREENA